MSSGEFDLRGLDPQTLQMLLGGALGVKQLQSKEAERQAKQASAKETAKVEAERYQDKLKQQEYVNKFNAIKFNTELSQDARDAKLAQLKFEFEKSKSRDPNYKPNLFELESGQLVEVPVGSPIPSGAKLPTIRSEELTPGQRVNVDQDLADYQRWIDEAIKSGEDLTPLMPYLDQVNKYSDDVQYIREIKKRRFLKDKVIWKKVSKASPKALQYLKDHPETKELFLEQFKYLPEGF